MDNPLYENIDTESESSEDDEEPKEEDPKDDAVVIEYTKGLLSCGLHWETKEVYAIWRFLRLLVNNDYMYEWIRTEMRGQFGYEILKENAFIDGDQKGERLRL